MDLLAALAEVVGPAHVLADPDLKASYEQDWTKRFSGPCLAAVRPADAAQTATVVRLVADAGAVVVPQGGNTGLVGGGVPPPAGVSRRPAVVLSTSRMDRIEPLDLLSSQVTVGAGVTLGALQRAAGRAGLAFAVDLAARDSATVGGMVATNAGGVHVLRYGSMRQQVLGVEAVTADGGVMSHLGGLLKDNTGYDLAGLLAGSEGTLAVITRVRLRLVPAEPEAAVALVGCETVGQALALTRRALASVEGLQAAEAFLRSGLELVMAHRRLPEPTGRPRPVYLLLEAAGRRDPASSLAELLDAEGLAEADSALGVDEGSARRLWEYREGLTEAVSSLGVPHKLDVTLPHASLEHFIDVVPECAERAHAGATTVMFGHIGDGNIHVNVVGPAPEDEEVDQAILELVARLGGSISAEHGIGRAKTRWLGLCRDRIELAAMRAIKDALDPTWVLNPGVILPEG